MTSKSTTKKTGTKGKTIQKNSKPNNILEILTEHAVWTWHEWNFKGKEEVSIISISDSNKDEEWLREQGYEKVKTISPNKVSELDEERDYDMAILTYLNKEMKDEEIRDDLLYEVTQRLHPVGVAFISVSNKSKIKLEIPVIEENKTFITHVL